MTLTHSRRAYCTRYKILAVFFQQKHLIGLVFLLVSTFSWAQKNDDFDIKHILSPGSKVTQVKINQDCTQAHLGREILFQAHATLKTQEGNMISPLQPCLRKLVFYIVCQRTGLRTLFVAHH